MKKTILAASVLAMAAVFVPVQASASISEVPTTSFSVTPEWSKWNFEFYNVSPGTSKTDPLDYGIHVPTTQHVEAVFTRLSSASTINANLYLVDADTNVAVRGPVKVTGLNVNHVFYDVTPGGYRLRLVNNGSSTITAAEGYLYVD